MASKKIDFRKEVLLKNYYNRLQLKTISEEPNVFDDDIDNILTPDTTVYKSEMYDDSDTDSDTGSDTGSDDSLT